MKVSVDQLCEVRQQIIDYNEFGYNDELTFGEVIYIATKFDRNYSFKKLNVEQAKESFNTISNEIVKLGEILNTNDIELISDQIGICLLLSIRSMVWDYGIFSPHTFLYTKYLTNRHRYQLLTSVVENSLNLNQEIDSELWEKLKEQTMIFFGGWYEYEACNKLMTSQTQMKPPFGASSLRVFQLLEKEWLITLGRDLSLTQLYNSLLGEVDELGKGLYYFEFDDPRFYCGCETADIFIYLTQMLNIMDLDLSAVLKNTSEEKYLKVLKIEKGEAIKRKLWRNFTWKYWFALCKKFWSYDFN